MKDKNVEVKVHYEVKYQLIGWNKWGHYYSSNILEYAEESVEKALGIDYGRRLRAVKLIKVETREEVIREIIP